MAELKPMDALKKKKNLSEGREMRERERETNITWGNILQILPAFPLLQADV